MENYLTSAIETAKIGGEILRKFYGRVKEIEFKGETDLVTEVDKYSELAIVDSLSSRFPHHSILAEEGTVTENDSEFKWILNSKLESNFFFGNGKRLESSKIRNFISSGSQ